MCMFVTEYDYAYLELINHGNNKYNKRVKYGTTFYCNVLLNYTMKSIQEYIVSTCNPIDISLLWLFVISVA